jgi:hypothetical protein
MALVLVRSGLSRLDRKTAPMMRGKTVPMPKGIMLLVRVGRVDHQLFSWWWCCCYRYYGGHRPSGLSFGVLVVIVAVRLLLYLPTSMIIGPSEEHDEQQRTNHHRFTQALDSMGSEIVDPQRSAEDGTTTALFSSSSINGNSIRPIVRKSTGRARVSGAAAKPIPLSSARSTR